MPAKRVSERPSKITTDLDYEADGKQHGFLSIPWSRDQSSWGSIPVPLTVVKNGDGPTVLLTGANHGDEYEGALALVKLRERLEPAQVSGRVLILPALNLPAFRAGKRTSPIDGGNMNRAFPGDPDGTVTQMIADYVTRTLLPMADAVLDIHAGGYSMRLVPCAVIHDLDDKGQMDRCMAAMRDFGAPYGLVLRELDSGGMLDGVVEDLGKVFVSTELGGGASLSVETIEVAERGVANFLKHFGILEGAPEIPEPVRLLGTPDGRSFVSARADGLFEICKEPGDTVGVGEVVGRIHFLEDPGRPPVEHKAERAGLVVCRHVQGLIARGDTLMVIADDWQG